MGALEKKFQQLKEQGKAAFIPFLTAGYPDKETSYQLMKTLAENGADVIELGIPYSEPLADGPVLQKASETALKQGMKVKDVFALATKAKEEIDLPIVLLVYYNVIYRYGLNRFIQEAKEAGVAGLVVPDLPFEEAEPLQQEGRKQGVDIVSLVAVTSTPERIKKIVEESRGFIYGVSLTGVTGVRSQLATGLGDWVKMLHTYTDKPIAIGFGISTPQQAAEVAKVAEGVIVGSAIIKTIEENKGKENLLELVGNFVGGLNKAIKGG